MVSRKKPQPSARRAFRRRLRGWAFSLPSPRKTSGSAGRSSAFSLGDRIPGLIFKGGTPLSKAYGLIGRFSEDIDLNLDRHDLGFTGDRDPASAMSKKARKALLDELGQRAIEAINAPFKAALSEAMSEALGEPLYLETSDNDPQKLIFTYSASLPERAALPYVLSSVRPEFGARSDHLPADQRDRHPFVHEQYPDLLTESRVSVKTLSASTDLSGKGDHPSLVRAPGCGQTTR